MARVGRKPLATGHVDRLDGSQHAKQRMAVILETLRGRMTIPDACQKLSVSESRFHALRGQWLQNSLELLEPRRAGRPPKPPVNPRQAELERTNIELTRELQQTQVQLEVQQALAAIGGDIDVLKKRASRRQHRKRRAR